MQPDGEQPTRPDENRPQFERPRPLASDSSSYQRRPPLSRGRFDGPVNRPQPVQPSGGPTTLLPVNQQPLDAEPQTFQESIRPIPEVQPSLTAEPIQELSPNPAAAKIEERSFKPPRKNQKSKIIKYSLVAVLAIVLFIGLTSIIKLQSAKNKPDKVMRDALYASLSTANLQVLSTSDNASIATKYDFNTPSQPRVSGQNNLNLAKGSISFDSYGTQKDTYISYTELPKTISPDLAKRTKNNWIQIRANGLQSKNVPPAIANLSDPYYLDFGPVLIGNFKGKTRDQLVNFLITHNVYRYDQKSVTKQQLGDSKVYAFPLKMDISYLKIASQSAAASEGIDPGAVQPAIDAMEQLRGAKITLYIDAKGHTISQFKVDKQGVTKTISYSNYGKTQLAEEPQTKLSWQSFAPLQNVINVKTDLTKAPY